MRVSVFNSFKPQTSDQVVSLERHPSKSSAFAKTVKKLFSGLNIAGYKSTTTTKLPHTRQFEQSLENMNRLWANQSARPAASARTDEITETEEVSLETLQKMLKSQVDINDPSSVRQAEWKLKKQKAAPSLEAIPEEPEVNESYIIHNTLINELGELEKQKPISDHRPPEEEAALGHCLEDLCKRDFTKLSNVNEQEDIRTSICEALHLTDNDAADVQKAIHTLIQRIGKQLPYISHPEARRWFFNQLKSLDDQLSLSTDTKALIRGIIDQQKRLQKETKRLQKEAEDRLNHLQATGMISPFEINGQKTNIAVWQGRPIVLANLSGGLKLPFYVSTGKGGKVDVPIGQWYPFFGLTTATNGEQTQHNWFIKDRGISEHYNSIQLNAIAKALDKSLGDIRSKCNPEWNVGQETIDDFKSILNRAIGNGATEKTVLTPETDLRNQDEKNISKFIDEVLDRLPENLMNKLQKQEEPPLGHFSTRKAEEGTVKTIADNLSFFQKLEFTELSDRDTGNIHDTVEYIGKQLPYISQPADRQLLLKSLTELADKQGMPVETKTLIDQITQQAGRLPLATFLGMAVPKKKSH